MIPEFTLRLICGLSMMWCFAPRRQITSGFFRIQMLLSLGLSVLVTVTATQLQGELLGSLDLIQGVGFGTGLCLAFLSFAGSVAWTLERRAGGFAFACLILACSIIGVWLPVAGAPATTTMQLTLRGLDAFSAAFFLGATTAAMLLGHWYLTATGMSLQPLQNYTRFFGGSVVLRITSVLLTLAFGHQSLHGNWTLLTLRWAGLVGPLVLAALTLRILKYRNTQSATGMLYAATILAFMSEMAASLLAVEQANLGSV